MARSDGTTLNIRCVIAYDRTAFGLNCVLWRETTFVELLYGLNHELGVDKAILVGNSAG